MLADHDRRRLEGNIRRFYVYSFLFNMQLWIPTWILYLQRERGLTLAQITALDAPFWLIMVLAQVPTGAFADRYGRRTSLVVGAFVYGVALFVFGIAGNFVVILVSYGLWAVGMAFGSGADMAMLYDNLAQLGRSDDYSRLAGRTYSIIAVAMLVSLLIGAPLAAATRLDVPVLVAAGITLLAGGVAWTLHEPPHERTERAGFVTTIRRGAVVSWRDKRLRYILAYAAVVRAAMFVPAIFTQPFLAHYSVPVSQFGILMMPGRVLGIVAALWVHRVVARRSERAVFSGMMIWICGCLAVLSVWNSPLAFVAFPLLAPVFSASNPVFSAYMNRHIPADQRATVLSLGQLLGSLIMIGWEPALGATAQAGGLTAGFVVGLACFAVAGVLTLGPWLALHADESAAEPEAVTA